MRTTCKRVNPKMIFTSLPFLIFLLFLLVVYWNVKEKYQNLVLLLANLVFYGCWDLRFLLIISSLAILLYLGAQLIESQGTSRRKKKICLISCLTISLGTLFSFKYFNFFLENLNLFFHTLGIEPFRNLSIILPVGLSFYTFALIAYVVDVYQGKTPAVCNFLNFFTFVSFFPTILSGPIERAGNIIPQLEKKRCLSPTQVQDALWLISWGIFKKVVMADHLNLIINPVIADPSSHMGGHIVLMILAFSFQIYLDFSSYSDIAIGCGKLLGIEIMLNFNLPYFSKTPQEFWHRWHISLSTWLRDYLYIPLGGNRKGSLRTSLNLMVTMVLGGLWHGAAWNFLLWGGYHGLLLLFHRSLTTLPFRHKISCPRWLSTLLTFILVAYGWMLFRAESFLQIQYFTMEILRNPSFDTKCLLWAQDIFWTISPLILVALWQAYKNELQVNRTLDWWQQALVYAPMFFIYFTLGLTAKPQQFIYFQF